MSDLKIQEKQTWHTKELNSWKLIVATEIGPRIVGAFFDGSDNLFHIFPETAGQTGGDEWNNYGGHRLWHSPEDKIRTQTIDNFPVDVKDTAKGITLHAGPDANAGIEKTIEI